VSDGHCPLAGFKKLLRGGRERGKEQREGKENEGKGRNGLEKKTPK